MLYLFGKTLHHSQIIFRLLQFASNGSLYIQPFGFETLTGTNTPPVCSITSPSNNASFTEPANITISASATDADGSISKVEFYRGTTKLGEDHTSPYS